MGQRIGFCGSLRVVCRLRDGLRHVLRRVHVLLGNEEPIEFYLAVKTRRKIRPHG